MIQIPNRNVALKIIDDQLHIIQKEHLIWNTKSQKFDKIHTFTEKDADIEGTQFVYLQHKETILLFRRKCFDRNRWYRFYLMQVYEYVLRDKNPTWNQWADSYKFNTNKIECMLSIRQNKYILFVAEKGIILILDLETRSHYKCEIEIPDGYTTASGGYWTADALILDDKSFWEWLLHGIIHEMNDDNIPIIDNVNDIIISYVMKEYLHLLNKMNGRHYRIHVQQILDNMKCFDFEQDKYWCEEYTYGRD